VNRVLVKTAHLGPEQSLELFKGVPASEASRKEDLVWGARCNRARVQPSTRATEHACNRARVQPSTCATEHVWNLAGRGGDSGGLPPTTLSLARFCRRRAPSSHSRFARARPFQPPTLPASAADCSFGLSFALASLARTCRAVPEQP
jgi:hypothetical protein